MNIRVKNVQIIVIVILLKIFMIQFKIIAFLHSIWASQNHFLMEFSSPGNADDVLGNCKTRNGIFIWKAVAINNDQYCKNWTCCGSR
ncbi:MAG: hypothetical protein WAM42_06720 [Candidatus Nitrosopolaris sp.]